MPLQQLTMNSNYSERPINPLPQKRKRNPPRAILVSSTRPTANSAPQVNYFFRAKSAPNARFFSQAKPFPQAKSIPPPSNETLVPRSSTVTTHSRLIMGNVFHLQLKGFGHLILSSSRCPKRANSQISLQVKRLGLAEKFLQRINPTSQVSSQPRLMSPVSIVFRRYNQQYHQLASR